MGFLITANCETLSKIDLARGRWFCDEMTLTSGELKAILFMLNQEQEFHDHWGSESSSHGAETESSVDLQKGAPCWADRKLKGSVCSEWIHWPATLFPVLLSQNLLSICHWKIGSSDRLDKPNVTWGDIRVSLNHRGTVSITVWLSDSSVSERHKCKPRQCGDWVSIRSLGLLKVT